MYLKRLIFAVTLLSTSAMLAAQPALVGEFPFDTVVTIDTSLNTVLLPIERYGIELVYNQGETASFPTKWFRADLTSWHAISGNTSYPLHMVPDSGPGLVSGTRCALNMPLSVCSTWTLSINSSGMFYRTQVGGDSVTISVDHVEFDTTRFVVRHMTLRFDTATASAEIRGNRGNRVSSTWRSSEQTGAHYFDLTGRRTTLRPATPGVFMVVQHQRSTTRMIYR